MGTTAQLIYGSLTLDHTAMQEMGTYTHPQWSPQILHSESLRLKKLLPSSIIRVLAHLS